MRYHIPMTTDDRLHIGDFSFSSRLLAGTGRHRSNDELVSSIAASGAEIVTVAIRRLNLDNPTEPTVLDVLDPDRYTILPNTAGCATVEEALMIAPPRTLARTPQLGETRDHPRP